MLTDVSVRESRGAVAMCGREIGAVPLNTRGTVVVQGPRSSTNPGTAQTRGTNVLCSN